MKLTNSSLDSITVDAIEKAISSLVSTTVATMLSLTSVEAEKTGVEKSSLLRRSSLMSMDVELVPLGVGSIVRRESSLEENTLSDSMLLTRTELVVLENSVNSSLASTNVVKTDLGVGKLLKSILSTVVSIDIARAELEVDTPVSSSLASIELTKNELELLKSSLNVGPMELTITELGNSSVVKNTVLTSVDLSKLGVGVGSGLTTSLVWGKGSTSSMLLVSENELEEANMISMDTRLLSAVAVGETDTSKSSVEPTSYRLLENALDVVSEIELISSDLDRENVWDDSDWTGALKPPLPPDVKIKVVADIATSSTKLSTLKDVSVVNKISSEVEVEGVMTSVLLSRGVLAVVCSVAGTLKLTLSTKGVGSASETLRVDVSSTSEMLIVGVVSTSELLAVGVVSASEMLIVGSPLVVRVELMPFSVVAIITTVVSTSFVRFVIWSVLDASRIVLVGKGSASL